MGLFQLSSTSERIIKGQWVFRLFSSLSTSTSTRTRTVINVKKLYSTFREGRETTAYSSSHSSSPSLKITAPSTIGESALKSQPNPKVLIRHFSALLTRHGKRGEWIMASVMEQLQRRYNHPNPVQIAVEAVKPVIRYYKHKSKRTFIPITLFPKTAEFMALKWIIDAARNRTFIGGRPDIVRGLIDEIDSVIQGTSSVYRKRFDTHRNPN